MAAAVSASLLGLSGGAAAALAGGASAVPTARGESALRVIPFPGTPDASPSSQVIFSALRPSDLRSVAVTGSRSGRHLGRLELLPAAAGTAFVPDRPFAPGETVRVSADLSSQRAGTASGDPGATHLSFSFGVGSPPPASMAVLEQNSERISAAGIGPTQHFHSEPNLRPTVITVTSDPDHSSGDIFLAMQRSPQVGPMILNARGQLVWFDPVGTASGRVFASDLAVQRYQGRPVLTWWQGVQLGRGEDVIMDRSYRKVAVVHAGNGYQSDFHEFQITPQGTALLDANSFTYTNLTSVGGPAKGVVLDDVIQEIDIKTGKVLWEWHSLGHVPLRASYMQYDPHSAFYDYFHLNSIQQLPDGNFLISARHTWSVYEISRATGKVIWTLGGKYSSFEMGPGTNFEWQHDARLHGQRLSVFDDGARPPEELQSSAKYLRVDTARRTVSLIRRFTHSPPLLTAAAGNAQALPNGNVFIGWGEQPQFSEYTTGGRQIFNGTFALGLTSYRAFRFPWVGRPLTRPSLAVSPGAHGHVKVYASWNGATQVASWRVLGGSRPGRLRPLGVTAARSGFETTIDLRSAPPYIAVQALDSAGKVLRTSVAEADRGSTARGQTSLRVIPFPGTPDASPGSHVIFSALRPADLRSVAVTGSRSGPHVGRWEILPAGAGTAFVPDRAFAPGETVRVRAALSSPRAGTASGEPGATNLQFSFGVGSRAPAAALDPGSHSVSTSSGAPTQHFHSAPELNPPVVSAFSDPDATSGDIFLAPQNSPQVGPMILGAQGRLVWFHPLKKGSGEYYAANLEVQHYQGRPVLTWWQGENLGVGEDVIIDRSYRTVAVVHAGDGLQADLHEFQITPRGTAILDALTFTRANLTSVGGPPNGSLLDNVIQEVDIKTGKVLWEWHALGHIPLSDSYEPYSPHELSYDAFHLNSIEQLPNGNLVISIRNTWAVYEISRKTGNVIWALGGKHSSFTIAPSARFEWQHDARLHPGGILSVFDDGSDNTATSQENQSSAKLLRIDGSTRTVSLVQRFTHSPPLLTGAAGNAQVLPNGDVFVGWGEQPEFSQYSPSGPQIFSGSFPLGVGSYRAFRFRWSAEPLTRPSLALVRSANGHVRLYASWNGATEVAAWRVLGGSSPAGLKSLAVTAPTTGFETAINVSGGPRYFAVQALNRKGKVLRTSAPAREQ